MMMSSPGLMHPSQSPHQGNPHPHPGAAAMMGGMGSPHHGPGAGHPAPPPPGALPSQVGGGGVPHSMAANLPHASPHQQHQQQEKDGKKEGEQMSAMPLPPEQYIKMYSDEHVAMGITPPPPPPIKDNYSMFGQPFSADDTIIQSLESQGIRRLYPATKDVDRKKELHKLNHSILVNFLDLIDLLIKAPESTKRDEKIDDMNLLFIHMHHLINEFRPHQARETLRVMLHVQKRKRHQVADKFQANLDKVRIFSLYITLSVFLY